MVTENIDIFHLKWSVLGEVLLLTSLGSDKVSFTASMCLSFVHSGP